jgi:hypothetical protein
MQMVNIFNELTIPIYYFSKIYDMSVDLLIYISNNLYHENIDTLTRDLEIALTTNANGEYI